MLFADVVRSMDIAASLGPERLREVMTELVDQSAAVVQRYGGIVDKFTGDGIMALFGAPITLEDHAFRACLAAMDIQQDAQRLAVEVGRRDGIDLRLRVGLNSGPVIAGEVGATHLGYTAVGEHVGMAQRMESVAPPGGVMLSESTARLVEDRVVLGERENVHIKGVDTGVPARRLLSTDVDKRRKVRHESRLVGRQSQKVAVAGLLNQAGRGNGTVVAITGQPGVGKTRLVRESAAEARRRGFDVFVSYCESHTREIPFHVVSRLLRTVFGIGHLTLEVARARVRSEIPGAGAEDLLLLDDLLGIRGADAPFLISVRTPAVAAWSSSSTPSRWHARGPRSISSRTFSGLTASVSRCSPTSRRWSRQCGRHCSSSTGPNIRGLCRASRGPICSPLRR